MRRSDVIEMRDRLYLRQFYDTNFDLFLTDIYRCLDDWLEI